MKLIILSVNLTRITLIYLYGHCFFLFRTFLKKRCSVLFSAAKNFHSLKLFDNKSKTSSLIIKQISLKSHWKELIDEAQGRLSSHAILKKGAKRRLFIDVSALALEDLNTGVQRVVKESLYFLYQLEKDLDFEPVAVNIDPSRRLRPRMIVAKKVLSYLGIKPIEKTDQMFQEVDFQNGDIFFMPDSTWGLDYTQFYPIFEKVRKASVPIISVVCDLLPITLDSKIIGKWLLGSFETWFQQMISQSDALLTISSTQKAVIDNYLKTHGLDRKNFEVSHWRLGYKKFERKGLEEKEHQFHIPQNPYLLMVGTIEPRKSYPLALSAMEILWKKGYPLKLCIAGKEGWNSSAFMKKLKSHPELHRACFFIEKPSDDHLHFLYKHARALLFLSQGEGFGLPLIEAASYGTSIVCSDLPIFREVAGNFATYIKLGSPQFVSEEIENWWKKKTRQSLPDTKKMSFLTWEESAKNLHDTLLSLASIYNESRCHSWADRNMEK